MQVGTTQNSKDLAAKMQSVNQQILELTAREDRVCNEQDLEKLECEVQALVRQLGDLIVAQKVQHTLEQDEAFRASAKELAHRTRKTLVNKGRVLVCVMFVGGTSLPLDVIYWARKGSAGKRGKGLYPELYLLGIHDRCSPLLASEIAQSSAALCSLEEAKHMMGSRGCELDIKTVRNVAKRFAARARGGQKAEPVLEALRTETLQGRRVVLSSDGGRLRIRSHRDRSLCRGGARPRREPRDTAKGVVRAIARYVSRLGCGAEYAAHGDLGRTPQRASHASHQRVWCASRAVP